MNFIHVQDVLQGNLVGQQTNLRGWVYRARGTKKMRFIILRDSTGIIQLTVVREEAPEAFAVAKKITIESAIEVTGIVRKDERSPGGHELQVQSLNIIHPAETFPITKDQSVSFLLNKRHLWLRSQKLSHVMKIRATLFRAFTDWFNNRGWIQVHGPMFTGSAVEGGATLFNLKYFDGQAYLTQSSQFYLETLIFSLEKVWTVAPSFRAEKSRTTRHLTEFWMLECEAAYMGLQELMRVEEELVSYCCEVIAKTHAKELEVFNIKADNLLKVQPPFKRISYTEAVEVLSKKGIEFEWGTDLGTEEERVLTQDEDLPIFVHSYPKEAKAFYHSPNPEDPKIVDCVDLLAPKGYGEIIGGGQRIHDLDILLDRIKAENLNPADYEWYVDLRRYGSVPHAGMGLGVERVIRWILELENIRDTIAYPRTINRTYP
ncbi:MAG: asparagine--tRNA ligase [Candidatus Helarchaeota archaeon]